MTVTAPETALRERLITILNAEFEPDGIVFEDDKIHPSLPGPRGGVFPDDTSELGSDGLVLEARVGVQLNLEWEQRVDPEMTVSPKPIEECAERLRRAMKADEEANSDHLWYYRVLRIEYPDDPTGNKTRLLALVQSESVNSALVETAG